MSRSSIYLATAALGIATIIGASSPASATTLNADVTGTVSFTTPTPAPNQVATVNGSFSSYLASPDLPQIAGGDLNRYSFTLTASNPTYTAANNTAVYGTVTGTINAYGQIVQDIMLNSLTFNINAGTLVAQLFSTDPSGLDPFGKGNVDFNPADGATVTLNYTPTGSLTGSVNGNIAFVPEPASLAVLGVGLLGLAVVRRRRA